MSRGLGKKSGLCLKKMLFYKRDNSNDVLLLSLVPFVSLAAARSLFMLCWKIGWPSGVNTNFSSDISPF